MTILLSKRNQKKCYITTHIGKRELYYGPAATLCLILLQKSFEAVNNMLMSGIAVQVVLLAGIGLDAAVDVARIVTVLAYRVGRAYGRARVGVGENHSLRRQPIQIGRGYFGAWV